MQEKAIPSGTVSTAGTEVQISNRLAAVDEAHGRSVATQKILYRECLDYGDRRYERLKNEKHVSHLLFECSNQHRKQTWRRVATLPPLGSFLN